MSGAPKLDGRRAKALDEELRRRAEAVMSGDGRSAPVGPVARAILAVAARIGEEVTRRLDQAPAKQADNFYTAAGVGRDPARPASLPVMLKLVDGVQDVLTAPARLQLMADAGGPVIFETGTRIDLAPGTIAALRGLDAQADAISMPSQSVMAARLPAPVPLARRLRSGAAAGATKLHIDPAAGLQPGTLLQLGEGEAARHHEAVAVEGDLVTVAPPLETGLAQGAPAVEVTAFEPFATVTRNHQSHSLYLGHASLLDVPSAVTITISGAPLPEGTVWSWWGRIGEDDPPAWHALKAVEGSAGLRFAKDAGTPVKTRIRGRESLWLRAELPGKSLASARARDVRLAIGGGGACDEPHAERCERCDTMAVAFEAVANNTPVVPNSPFYPLGREPRLFDSFYIGSSEAFSKIGAEISLCFELAGAALGPIAAIGLGAGASVFGVGTDRLLYRLQLAPQVDRTAQPGAPRAEAGLRSLPPPVGPDGTVYFQKQSPVAAWTQGITSFAAAAAEGAIYVAELAAGADPSSAKWIRLPFDGGGEIASLAVLAFDGGTVLYALAGDGLHIWRTVGEGAAPVRHGAKVRHLAAVDGINAIVIVEDAGAKQQVSVEAAGQGQFKPLITLKEHLPAASLRVHAGPESTDPYFIAGYDRAGDTCRLKLVRIDAARPSASTTEIEPPLALPLPVSFSRGSNGLPPMLSIADETPLHILWYRDATGQIEYRTAREPVSIGFSDDAARSFVQANGFVAAQRPDFGLLYRADPGDGLVRDLRLAVTPAALIPAASVPATASTYAKFAGAQRNEGLFVLNEASDDGAQRLLYAASQDLASIPTITGEITFYRGESEGVITPVSTKRVMLTGSARKTDLVVRVNTGTGLEIWTFGPRETGVDTDKWPIPTGFPTPPEEGWHYTGLLETGRAQSGATAAAMAPGASELGAAVAAGMTIWAADETVPLTVVGFGGMKALAMPHRHISNGVAYLLAAPPSWDSVGPSQPSNPALSWEYWNGQSWWALGSEQGGGDQLIDRTVDFQRTGGVFFTVPADIRPTDVGGRTSHWIRVRLVGGTYGEAKVTATTRDIGGNPKVTEQIVNRDVGAIRAPYVGSLKLGYCALDLVRPENVLTEDSFGAVDQTNANEAGLEFPVFIPIAELMNSRNAAEEAAAAAADMARCDDPCPTAADEAETSPCDAPGAYDSCDSPCIAPPGPRRPAAGGEQGFVRGLMLGFARRFSGDTISLYVDADPAGPPAELRADVLRAGRFIPINVVSDTSYGLTEPGIVTLSLPDPPDQSDLFGSAAHWLRLRPGSDAANWSPRLRGVYLNAVLARSVETRAMERLGTSSGVENQVFQLSEAPVDPDSLVLRVRESLAEEDNPDGRLDVKLYPSGLPGQWVRWEAADDLIEEAEPRRVFTLDADQGVIRFGNGKTGRIPPLGSDVLAELYARVVGTRANRVAPGKQLQLLAPLAGVERAVALDEAAGGSDAEPLESARRRAPAKIRHGGRILTRADLEDHALTLAPGIAQVRAESRRGGMRLVVAMTGADPRPSPAALRAFAAALREVSGYGLARPGGLTIVGPRLLPLAIELVLKPHAPDLFAEAAEQAKNLLGDMFDQATGNHDGKGWPLGRLPDEQDIAAALVPIDALALPVRATLRRADREVPAERALPGSIPSDVLVRLDPAAIVFERSQEAAA